MKKTNWKECIFYYPYIVLWIIMMTLLYPLYRIGSRDGYLDYLNTMID